MNMKKIYFVRHAECQDEQDEVHMQADSSLSEEGREQAALLAGRFSHTPFNTLISSPLERSKETAEFIGLASGKDIVFNNLFDEIKEPTFPEISNKEGVSYDAVRGIIQEKWHLPAWHYANEENFTDAKKRAIKALKFLEDFPAEKIVVITHGHFLTMLFLIMAFGKMVKADEFTIFDSFSHTDNTGISLCELKDRKWKMRRWNDITHVNEKIH